MKLSEWRGVSKEGEIPEELLPCRYLQYRWRIHHSFDISPYLGIGGGQLSMTFEMQCGKLHSVDTVTFLLTTLRDPILGWVAAFYTYYPAKMETTGPDSCRTFGGDQLDWWYDGEISATGVSEGFIDGWLVSPVYELSLGQGEKIDVLRHFPCSGIPSPGWYMEVRTAQEAAPMLSIQDPQVGDQLHFRVYEGALLCQIWLAAAREWHGVVSGMQVALGGNGLASIQPGEIWVGFRRYSTEAPALVSVGSGRQYVIAREQGSGLVFETLGEVPQEPATLIAIVEGGAVHQAQTGILVRDDVSEYGGLRRETGRFLVRATTSGGQDIVLESRDFGLTWREASE